MDPRTPQNDSEALRALVYHVGAIRLLLSDLGVSEERYAAAFEASRRASDALAKRDGETLDRIESALTALLPKPKP